MPASCSASTSKFPSTTIAVPAAPDGVQRGVQAVERLLLVKQRRLGRVDVLAILGLGIEQPPAEADHPLLAIEDRQHHAIAEEVVAAALVHADQAQALEVRRRDLVRRQVRRQRVPARRARSRRESARARRRRCRASRRRRARPRPPATRTALRKRRPPAPSRGTSGRARTPPSAGPAARPATAAARPDRRPPPPASSCSTSMNGRCSILVRKRYDVTFFVAAEAVEVLPRSRGRGTTAFSRRGRGRAPSSSLFPPV